MLLNVLRLFWCSLQFGFTFLFFGSCLSKKKNHPERRTKVSFVIFCLLPFQQSTFFFFHSLKSFLFTQNQTERVRSGIYIFQKLTNWKTQFKVRHIIFVELKPLLIVQSVRGHWLTYTFGTNLAQWWKVFS